VSKDERAWFFSFKEKRAKTVSEQIFHAGENLRVFVSTDLILAKVQKLREIGGTPVLILRLLYGSITAHEEFFKIFKYMFGHCFHFIPPLCMCKKKMRTQEYHYFYIRWLRI